MPTKDPVKLAAKRKRYREAHRDRLRELVRDWESRNPDSKRERDRKYREANAEKVKARKLVSNAVAAGHIVRGACERESEGTCKGRVELHHDDYSRPLDVRPLCVKHHEELHHT
jgi:hypothetical protein